MIHCVRGKYTAKILTHKLEPWPDCGGSEHPTMAAPQQHSRIEQDAAAYVDSVDVSIIAVDERIPALGQRHHFPVPAAVAAAAVLPLLGFPPSSRTPGINRRLIFEIVQGVLAGLNSSRVCRILR